MVRNEIYPVIEEFLYYLLYPKLFEKMVCDKLTPVIRPRISDAQHGFFKGRSTVTNLVEFSNSVIGEMENGRQVDGVH
jgi:hypothetical protein